MKHKIYGLLASILLLYACGGGGGSIGTTNLPNILSNTLNGTAAISAGTIAIF